MKTCTQCKETKNIDNFYKKGKHYHATCKQCVQKRDRLRKLGRKIKIVHLMGNKCSLCGYDKNYGALDIHHANPKEKEFTGADLKERPWCETIKELKKCVLLCRNCHAETHYPHLSKSGNIDYLPPDPNLNSDKDIRTASILTTGICPVCKHEVYGTKYCSTKCASFRRRKAKHPTKAVLSQLIATTSWMHIGRLYGVSDNAVRKWAKKYCLI